MPDSAQVLQLLADALDSDRSPDEVCAEFPELLEEVRLRWEECRLLKDEMDVLLAPSDAACDLDPVLRRWSSEHKPSVPGYELGSILGRGGMGVVYRARHIGLDRMIALKMLLSGMYASSIELARFLREARAIAGLKHPNLVQVYEVGEFDGRPFYTMELLDGGTLAEKLNNMPQPSSDAASMLIFLCAAVQAAHDGGIVHRDLKPSNILLTADGTPKISDFGLARSVGRDDSFTVGNAGAGTPSYMAPEQAAGSKTAFGPAGDVYSLGVILYEMLTGRPPFRGESAAETRRQLLSDDPLPPSRLNPRVPRDLETICLMCLQKAPERRYESARLLADDLRRFQSHEPIMARPSGFIDRAAKWIRRHPTATTAYAATAILLLAAAGASSWLISDRAATVRAAEQDLTEAVNYHRQSAWPDARAAIDRAALRLGSGGPQGTRERLDRARRNSAFVATLSDMRQHSGRIVNGADVYTAPSADYKAAFAALQLFELNVSPDVAADAVRHSDVRAELVTALEEWALSLTRDDLEESDSPRRAWISSVLKAVGADPTGWRDRALSLNTWKDAAAIESLISTAPIEQEPVPLLLATAQSLAVAQIDPTPFLARIQEAYPSDYYANSMLGDAFKANADAARAAGYYQAAVALRPTAAAARFRLGRALIEAEHIPEGIIQLQKSIELDSSLYMVHAHLGNALIAAGRRDEGYAVMEAAIARFPREGKLYAFLGHNFANEKREAEAVQAYQRALELSPKVGYTQRWLTESLIRQGRHVEALAAWQTAIADHPDDIEVADGYAEFCAFLGDRTAYHNACVVLLERFGKSKEPRLCERVGRACLLLDACSTEEQTAATAAIDRAVVAGKGGSLANLMPYFLFAKSLAEYRNGHMEAAVEAAEQAKGALEPAPTLVTSMAQFRVGRVTEAKATLAGAIASFDWSPERMNQSDQREVWIYHLLRREAEALISSPR